MNVGHSGPRLLPYHRNLSQTSTPTICQETTTEMLAKQFQCYKSFARARVVRTKNENKARGFGFVSFLDPMDCAKVLPF